MLGTSQITNIVQLVEETLNDNPVTMLAKKKFHRLNLPKIRKNPAIKAQGEVSDVNGAETNNT